MFLTNANILLSSLYDLVFKLDPKSVLKEKYEQIYQKLNENPEVYSEMDMMRLLEFLSDFRKDGSMKFFYFQMNYYNYTEFSFLENYNDNVKTFFETLINDNNIQLYIFFEDPEYYLSFLKSVEDLIQVIDCINKNYSLLTGEMTYIEKVRNQMNKNKSKKYEMMSKFFDKPSKLVKLIFVFNDKEEIYHVNSIFFTDNYFRNSFELQDEYTFLLGFDHIDNFSEQIVKYLTSGEIDLELDKEFFKYVSYFAEMFCIIDLVKICSDILNEETRISKYTFFRREINTFDSEFGKLNYIRFQSHFTIFTLDGYFLCIVDCINNENFLNGITQRMNFISNSYNCFSNFYEKMNIKFSEQIISDFMRLNQIFVQPVVDPFWEFEGVQF